MLTIKFCGDMVLRDIANPVTEITDLVRAQLDEMTDIMENEKGVGLAAPQVGIQQRFLVMKEIKSQNDKGKLIKMINPRIIKKSENLVSREEGCLSVLGPDGYPVYADVIRPDAVTVEWTDENGNTHVRDFDDITARVAQHEIDHLDGVLFIDYLSSAKREMILNKVRKFQKMSKAAV